MGRVGEVITRTWQTADKMKLFRGQLPDEEVNLNSFRYTLPNFASVVWLTAPQKTRSQKGVFSHATYLHIILEHILMHPNILY